MDQEVKRRRRGSVGLCEPLIGGRHAAWASTSSVDPTLTLTYACTSHTHSVVFFGLGMKINMGITGTYTHIQRNTCVWWEP